MATAIASNRASNASIRRKTLSLFSLPGQDRKAGSSLNRNVAFNVALTGCFVMHFYSDSPMHLLSGLDTQWISKSPAASCRLPAQNRRQSPDGNPPGASGLWRRTAVVNRPEHFAVRAAG